MRLPTIQSRRPERLPLLADAWPEAALASRVELGLQTVPVTAILGTVSPSQTRRDRSFMPFRIARGNDWESRWQRLQRAARTLAILPPVDLVQVGEGFWVVDGHNRVALAHSVGQLAIDANVTVLRRPGSPAVHADGDRLSPLIADGARLRAAMRARQPAS
jgi:hypothetical protein